MIFSGDVRLEALMQSFWLSLVVAGLATLVSCVLGTTAALALHRWRTRLQGVHHALVYTPLIMPDILIGISLLMLFVACGVDCGFWTILIAHVTFCVSYVVMTVLARLQDFDYRIVEAAYDLGAGPWYTFFKVELPLLMPGIVKVPKSLDTAYAGENMYVAAIRNTCGIMILLPLIILYVFMQRYIIQGIERSGITG